MEIEDEIVAAGHVFEEAQPPPPPARPDDLAPAPRKFTDRAGERLVQQVVDFDSRSRGGNRGPKRRREQDVAEGFEADDENGGAGDQR
jgi:hypothetical protein